MYFSLSLISIVSMINLLLTDFTSAVFVKLHVVTSAIRGEPIRLNCTSDRPPTSLTTQFIVENVTYANLRLHNKDCYNGPHVCAPEICSCAEDGQDFFFRIQTTERRSELQVSCVMRFGLEKITDSTTIHILDQPPLTIEMMGHCNGKSQIDMRCKFNWKAQNYGFRSWYHSVNGILIRNLTGDLQDNMTTLRIDNCSNQDVGSYICIGWINLSDKVFEAKESSLIEYDEPPVVVKMFTFELSLTITVFSVKFYSLSGSMSWNWYKDKIQIKNSTKHGVVTEKCPVDRTIYEKEISHQGYVSNLTITDNTPGKFTIVLQNNYGETRVSFHIPEDKKTFRFELVIWILTVILVFVVTIVLTTVFMSYRSQHYVTENQQTSGRTIYYAAPAISNQAHNYSTTQPQYAEAEVDENIGTSHQYEEINDDDIDKDVHIYETAHQYIEMS